MKENNVKGFFEEKKKPETKKKKSSTASEDPCKICGLSETCITPRMPYSGKGKKKILIVAEAPGKTEDEKGTQLVGEAGKTLREILSDYDINLDRDCWKTNAVICRPPKNVTPTNTQIQCCRPNLFKTINELNPEKIITLGGPALQSLIGEKQSVTAIAKWVGWQIPDQDLKCWVFPNYHPQYLNYNKDDVVLHNLFKRALKTAVEWDKEFPVTVPDVVKMTKPYEASICLDSFKSCVTPVAIDFETTGLRPYREGHKILCMSVTTGHNRATAFPIFYEDKSFMLSLKKFLRNERIKKIGANIKFENIWASVNLGCDIKGWIWDTVIVAHILDGRGGITGVKFQTYVNYGISNYNKEVEKYIEVPDKDPFGFNKLDQVPLDDLLQYCGEDSIYESKLFFDQKLEKGNINGFDLFMEGQKMFSEVEQNGLNIDEEYYEKIIQHLTKKQSILSKKILSSKELENWKGEFNFNSSDQLRKLLFVDLGYVGIKKTKKDKDSTDAETLEKINTPFTNRILEYKKLDKIKGTYLSGFLKNSFQGKIYPSFNLNLVVTYRSSSDSPNLQNVPVRDLYAQELCRTGIKPSPGRQLLSVDYSGIEVRISACYHKDPNMIKYIRDPKSDMHRDVARQLLLKEDISKDERFYAKNNFTFAEFYGDYWGNIAPNLWKNMPEGSIPFSKYSKFEKHVKEIEDDFWNNRFKVYNQWRKDTWKRYQKTGKLYTHTGFICTGHLDRKQVANYPIQGSAFHCLLWSMNEIHKYMKENKFESNLLGEVHDETITDLVPGEKKELLPVIRRISTIDIIKHWPWIIVPLDIEAEVSEIDGNWAEMKEQKI